MLAQDFASLTSFKLNPAKTNSLFMHLIPIAWLYVALLMAVAEATSPIGTVLGAVITFVFYGVLPMSLVMYVLGTPARKRAIKAREAKELAALGAQPAPDETATRSDSDLAPDGSGKTATDAVAPVRKEP